MESRSKSKTVINDKLGVSRFSLALNSQKISQVSDTTVLNIKLVQEPLENCKFKGPTLIIKSPWQWYHSNSAQLLCLIIFWTNVLSSLIASFLFPDGGQKVTIRFTWTIEQLNGTMRVSVLCVTDWLNFTVWGWNSPQLLCIGCWQSDWCPTCSEQKHGFLTSDGRDTEERSVPVQGLNYLPSLTVNWQDTGKSGEKEQFLFNSVLPLLVEVDVQESMACSWKEWMSKPPATWSFSDMPYLLQCQVITTVISTWQVRMVPSITQMTMIHSFHPRFSIFLPSH